jgi:hypothetical protein
MSNSDATFGVSAPARRVSFAASEPLSRMVWRILGCAAIALFAASKLAGFKLLGLPAVAVYIGTLVTAGLLAQRFGMRGLSAFLDGVAQLQLAAILFGLLALILASTNLPYRDAELVAIDQILFPFDWLKLSAALTAEKAAADALSFSYSSIRWQPVLLVLALATAGQLRRLRVFILAWVVSLVVVIAIFPFVPAVGFYLHSGVTEADMPGVFVDVAWTHFESLQPLRDGVLRELHFLSYSGIVTFPSFHAAAAVLLAWGFYGVRFLRWPALVLNTLMLVASMPVGGHYIIDIVAGIVIAYAALMAVQWMAVRTYHPAGFNEKATGAP